MPDIYSIADTTYIWLGPRADGSDEAMTFIQSARDINTDDANIDIDSLVPTRALVALFNRSWWYRTWVVQEAVLSQNAIVICGTKKARLRDFQTLVEKEREMRQSIRLAHREGNLETEYVRIWFFIPPILPFYEVLGGMSSLRAIRKGDWSTKEAAFLLAGLLHLTVRFQSTLPRDKLYGLLGLVPELQGKIVPSYGPDKSDGDVFKETTVFLMKWTNSIKNVFNLIEPELGRTCGGPSWAIHPAWAPRKDGRQKNMTPFSLRGYKADGGFWTWLWLTPMDVIKG